MVDLKNTRGFRQVFLRSLQNGTVATKDWVLSLGTVAKEHVKLSEGQPS